MSSHYRGIVRSAGPYPKEVLMKMPESVLLRDRRNQQRYAELANLRVPPHAFEVIAVPNPASNRWHLYVNCPGDDDLFFELSRQTVLEPRNLTNGYVVFNFCYMRRVAANKRQKLISTGLELFSYDTKIARWLHPFDWQRERLEILDISGLSPTTDNHVEEVKSATLFLADKRVELVTPVKTLAEQPIVVGHAAPQEQPFTFMFPDEVRKEPDVD